MMTMIITTLMMIMVKIIIITFVLCFDRFALTSSSQAAGSSDCGNLLVHAWGSQVFVCLFVCLYVCYRQPDLAEVLEGVVAHPETCGLVGLQSPIPVSADGWLADRGGGHCRPLSY